MGFKYYDVLDSTERKIYELRMLYAEQGYAPYKMSKFEEYDFYGKNRNFLVSDRVITFTDTNGKLMALKPDVTLSIIKNNTNAIKGSNDDYVESGVQKLYYNENVYRVSKGTDSFKEIMQVGVECIGDVDVEEVAEVLELAVASLETFGENSVLDVSDLDILSTMLDKVTDSRSLQAQILKCVSEKNIHGIKALCEDSDIPEDVVNPLLDLIALYGPIDEVMPKLNQLAATNGASDAATSFEEVLNKLNEDVIAKIIIDFSVVSDMNYYNGIVFKGFIEGVPEDVLSGGQYDNLLGKMKRKAKGIGFAINMDTLDRVDNLIEDDDDIEETLSVLDAERKMLNVALPKGRLGEKVYAMFEKAGFECPSINEENRKLIFENEEAGVRYFWVKPSDVAIYVERGAADVGVAGKDILLEYEPDIYELLDMNIGKCRMAVAGPKDYEDDPDRTLRVATKFVRTAREYYSSRGRDIDIIHLNGSIEIAPILGLSDVIVDIVETGTTLKENDLEVKREIFPISARLIANKSSFKFKNEPIENLLAQLKEQVKGE